MASFFIAATSLAYALGLGAFGLKLLRAPLTGALAAAYGALLLYTLLLCSPSLEAALVAGTLGSAAGWLLARKMRPRWSVPYALAMAAAFTLFTFKILGEPIEAWDARSIWFFHARKIFHNGSIWAPAGWTNPFYLFSHADYPLFLPALAAAVAQAVGGWNELAPKLALLLLLAPALLSLRTFCRAPASSVFLLGLVFLRFGALLWNGYLDGYVALYAALAALHLGAWLEGDEGAHLAAGAAMLALGLNLKNEGALVVASAAAAFALVGPSRAERAAWLRPVAFAPLAVALLDRFLLLARNAWWGVTSDLKTGEALLGLVTSRLRDPFSWGLIFIDGVHSGDVDRAVVLLLLVLIPMRFRDARLPRAAAFSAICAGIYFTGLATLYFLSPYDLDWHVSHSADRVMLPVTSLLLVTLYFCIRKLERAPG